MLTESSSSTKLFKKIREDTEEMKIVTKIVKNNYRISDIRTIIDNEK